MGGLSVLKNKKGYMVKIRYISNEKGVFYWKYVLGGGFNKNTLGSIYQYLVKLEVLFNIS